MARLMPCEDDLMYKELEERVGSAVMQACIG